MLLLRVSPTPRYEDMPACLPTFPNLSAHNTDHTLRDRVVDGVNFRSSDLHIYLSVVICLGSSSRPIYWCSLAMLSSVE